jgi:transcription antitermination factor NusG
VSEALARADFQPELPASTFASDSTSWYGVQTRYRHEQRIAHDLAVKGFTTYLPLIKELHQWSDRKKAIEVPAFSGYLFVRQDATLRNRVRVLETSGVVRILGDNQAPVPVPDSEIESLRKTLDSRLACSRCECLPIGSMVEVKSGPLAGVRGRLTSSKNNLRLIVSVSAMSQAISVEVRPEEIEAVAEDKNAGRRQHSGTTAL